MLVMTSGLFVRTFTALASVPTGINADGLLVANVTVLRAGVAGERAIALYHQLTEAVRGLPGVAAAATSTPITAANSPVFVTPLTRTGDDATDAGQAKLVYVTPGWFDTYGVPIRAGRDVDPSDRGQTLPVAVVNDAFISRFFPGPIGGIDQSARVAVGARGERTLSTRTIVGVVGNTVYQSPREATQPIIYMPLAQYDYPLPIGACISVTARTVSGDAGRLSHDVSAAIVGINPRLVVATRTVMSQIDDALRQERLLAGLISVLGLLALLLAALGVFGVTAYGVARRRRELAVRIAIGATASTILREVSAWVLVPMTVGLTLGVAGSFLSGRLLSSLLFGVATSDLETLLIAVVILAATAAVAMALPAWRALHVDPARTLRSG
jgi:MacB-like periplasmic core domain